MGLGRRDAIEQFYPIGVGPCMALINASLFQQMRFEVSVRSRTIFDDLLKNEHALQHLNRYGVEIQVFYIQQICVEVLRTTYIDGSGKSELNTTRAKQHTQSRDEVLFSI